MTLRRGPTRRVSFFWLVLVSLNLLSNLGAFGAEVYPYDAAFPFASCSPSGGFTFTLSQVTVDDVADTTTFSYEVCAPSLSNDVVGLYFESSCVGSVSASSPINFSGLCDSGVSGATCFEKTCADSGLSDNLLIASSSSPPSTCKILDDAISIPSNI